MKHLSKLLSAGKRIWVYNFYRSNAGFFFLIAFLLANIGKTEVFSLLAQMAAFGVPALFAIYFFPSLLYTLKTIRWGIQVFQRPENEFFRMIAFLPAGSRLFLLFVLQAGVLVPLVPFFIHLIITALQLGQAQTAWLSAVFFLLIHVVSAMIFAKIPAKSQDYYQGNQIAMPLPVFTGWLCRDLFQGSALLLLSTKVLSVFLISGSVMLFYKDVADQRLLSLAILAAAFLHSGLLDMYSGLEARLLFLKNLPLSLGGRLALSLKWIYPLLLPEFLLILLNHPAEAGLGFRIGSLLFFTGLVMLLIQLRYLFQIYPKRKAFLLPAIFFLFSFIIMYRMPPGLFALLLLITSLFLNHLFYYQTEFSDEANH
jgi:hypothetical protein